MNSGAGYGIHTEENLHISQQKLIKILTRHPGIPNPFLDILATSPLFSFPLLAPSSLKFPISL